MAFERVEAQSFIQRCAALERRDLELDVGAADEDVEDDPEGPNVRLWAPISFALEELWRGVGRTPAPCGEQALFGVVVAEAEIRQLDEGVVVFCVCRSNEKQTATQQH